MRIIISSLLFLLLTIAYALPTTTSLSNGSKVKDEFLEIENAYKFGDYKKGLSLNKKLLDSYTGVDQLHKARLLFLMAKGSELHGNFADFKQYTSQAEALFKNVDNSQVNNLIISCKPGLEAYISYGDFARAEDLYKALTAKIGSAQADKELVKDLEYKYVIILYKKGFSVKAQSKLFGLIKDKEEYLKQLQATPATKENKKTLRASIVTAKRDFATLINLQSRIYFENGSYESADSLAIKNELWLKANLGSNEYAMVEALVIKGSCSEIREDYRTARKYYEKAYKILAKTKEGKYRRTSRQALDVYTSLITNFRLANQIKDYKRTKDALDARLRIHYGASNYYYTRIIQLDIEREKQQGDWDKVIKYSAELFSKSDRLPEDHPDRVDFYAQQSNAYIQLKDFKNAQASLEKSALVQKHALTDKAPLYHLQLLAVANYYVNFGDNLKEAEKIYLYSLDSLVTPQISHRHVKYLPCVYGKSKLYELSDRFSLASKVLDEAKEDIIRHYGRESIYSAMLLERVGNLNIRVGNYNSALTNLAESLRLFDKYGKFKYDEEEGLAHATLASLKLVEGNYDKAEQELRKAIKLSKRNSAASDNYINQLAQLYINTGRFSKIEDILLENIELNEQQFGTSHSRLIAPLSHLANLYIISGDYSKAEKFLSRSEEICLIRFGENSSSYAELLKLRADLNIAIGDYAKADACVSKTIDVYKKMYSADHIQLGMAYNKLALIHYYDKSTFNVVDNEFKTALSILEKNLGDQNPLNAEVHKNYSLFLLDNDKVDAAKQHLEAANKIWTQKYGTQTRYSGDYYYLSGMIAYKESKYSDAKTSFQKSKSIYESVFSSQHPDYLKALSKSGQMAYILKDYSEAIKSYDQAINSYQVFIRDQFPSLSEREKSKTWRNISKDFEFYYSMAYDLHKTNPDLAGNMYNMVLKTKALMLNSTVKIKRNILSSGDTLLIKNYQNWLDKKELLTATLSMNPEELKAEGIVIGELNKEIEQLEKHLSESSELFAASNEKKNQFEWKQLKSMIKPEEAVVEMVRFRHFNKTFTDSVIYAALIIDSEVKDNPKFVPFTNGMEMESKCLKSCRNSLKFRTEDKNGYNNYWEKIDNAIAKSVTKVYFSPDGVYNQLNIEAFKAPLGKYLLEKYQVVQITTSRDLIKKNLEAAKAKKGTVAATPKTTSYTLFGNPNYYITSSDDADHSLKQLPGAEVEVKEIYSLLKQNSKQAQIFVNDSASENKVKHLKSPYVFHVATHGFFIPDIKSDNKNSSIDEQIIQNPLYRSGLVLANGGNVLNAENGNGISTGDGILTSYEAMNLDFDNTELVILSACETGLGDVQMGEGVYGLQRAFIVSGAKAVIMSLFKVDDTITKELMENFYSAWLKTGNKRQAFTQAKFEVMKKHSDPIDWSSFVMIGLE